MTVAISVAADIAHSSWIRRMFEAGRIMKQELGEDNVHDFSLGNPLLEPPVAFQEALADLVAKPPPGMHRYMSNNGFLSTRTAVARYMAEHESSNIRPDDVIMSVGAAGAIHMALHAVLNPNDEVIVLPPYFVEYGFYIDAHRGKMKLVDTTDSFDLDLSAIDNAITARTKMVIINTPNNPTGRIYSADQLAELAALLSSHEKRLGHEIYLLVDTPYARITYDGASNPPLLGHKNTFIAHSHSKDLGLAGERIGYLVINPASRHRDALQVACAFSNRVLGFINAPAIIQLALERSIDATVNMDVYRTNRDKICRGLEHAGYSLARPQGAFYVFPKTPIPDDVAFCKILQEHNILAVPGRGFGRPGHIRIAFCVPTETVTRSLDGFSKAWKTTRGLQ